MNRTTASNDTLVLSVFLSTKGFGFAVFEGPTVLVDWGVKGVRGTEKNGESLRKIRELLDFYHPDVLTMDNCKRTGSRRAKRIQALTDQTTGEARRRGIASSLFSRADVRSCFSKSDARTKREIAEAIVREFPELEPRLPPIRKIWMSEDARMNIFDAAALAMTFFDTKSRTKRAA
jgi:hypothetical protein